MSDELKKPRSKASPSSSGKVVSREELSDEYLVPEELGLSPAQRHEMLRRLRAHIESPGTYSPIEDVIERLKRKLSRFR